MREPDRISKPYQITTSQPGGRLPRKETHRAKAWKIPAPPPSMGVDGSVARWIVYMPGAHAFWCWWLISVVHLRETEGLPAPFKRYAGAEYEFFIAALDPKHYPPSLEGDQPYHFLTPLDAIVQFHGVDDAGAARVAEMGVDSIMAGNISPDSDFRSAWEQLIPGTAACVASGRHEKH